MNDLATKIKVMQAALDGKEIESYVMHCPRIDWILDPSPEFNWEKRDYRIKPEPLELWVNVYEDFTSSPYANIDAAKRGRGKCADLTFVKTIKVREVIE